ncbi:MAG: pilus assembly protein TadG-related protein [Acidimicrobiia bacterium]
MSRRLLHTRDRGAVVPIVALLLPVLMVMTAFAVDLGSQRVLRRDLQADADVIALDLVRLADGRTLDQIQTAADFLGYVNESFANNDVPPASTVASLAGIVTYGDWDDARDPQFVPSGPAEIPNAVQVVLSGSQDHRFMPGSGRATRRAVATTDGLAVFSVGSRLASLSTAESALLDPILSALFNPPDEILPIASVAAVPFSFAGASASPVALTAPAQEADPTGGITLDALSYTGLANANVVLEDILGFAFADVAAVDADVASPADILLTDIKLLTLVEASADALAASGEGAEIDAAVDYLLGLALDVDPDLTVNLGELLGLSVSEPGAVLGTSVNLFDLLLGSAQLANAENLAATELSLALPKDLFSSIPGVQDLTDVADPRVDLSLTVVEGPQFGTGRPNDPSAFAETSQVDLDLQVGVGLRIDLGGLDWPLLSRETELAAVELVLPVRVDVAKARSTLTELVCAGPSGVATMDLPTITKSAGIVVGTEPSGSVPVDLESPTPVTGAGEIATVSIGGHTAARVGLAAEVAIGPDAATPINDLAVGAAPFRVGTSGLGLANLAQTNLDVDLVPGSTLGAVLDLLLVNPVDFVVDAIVEQVLNPLLAVIDEYVVTWLLEVLGLGVAGADVTAIDAQCDVPKLVD